MSRIFHLTLHGIGEPNDTVSETEREYWLPAAEFHDVVHVVGGRGDLRITFDDGNLSDLNEALPALVERDLKALFFVCAGRVGTPGYLGIAELRTLADAGMTIGSHGMEHVRWRGLSAAGLEREIIQSKARLEQGLGTSVIHAACPYGEYDRRSLATLENAGFERVYTSDGGLADGRAWLQPRTTLRRGIAIETIDGLAQTSRGPRQTARRIRSLIKQFR